jgi:DNA-binding CsgD family transcriptional regulator
MNTDELAGRGDLLLALFDAVQAVDNRPDAILLVGEAGVGKTTCLLAVAAMADTAGHCVLETAGSEAERKLPFAGLHSLLRPLLASAESLPSVQHSALFTALGMRNGGSTDPFVISVAALNLIRAASQRRPLTITVDDVHWLDDETRHVLAFVARRLDGAPVVVVATSSVSALADLRDVFREVRVNRLDDAAAYQLLSRVAPDLDPEQREWVMRHALGNPLALVEVAQAAPPSGTRQTNPLRSTLSLTPALERAFARGWDQLSDASRDAVLVAALDPDASLQEILAAAAKLIGHRVTTEVLEAPQSLGLLNFDETRVRFSHPLVTMAIVQKESVSRTHAAHEALGEVIAVNTYRRAWHRALGSPTHDDSIAAELEATTSDSLQGSEARAAIMALERAAQLSSAASERGRRVLLATRHAFALGDVETATRLLGAASNGELSEFDHARAELMREALEGVFTPDSNRVIQLCDIAQRAAEAGETDLALDAAFVASRLRCAGPLSARARADLTAVARILARDSRDARAVAVLALADPIGNGAAVLLALEGIDDIAGIDGDALSAYAVAARAVGNYPVALSLFERAEIPLQAAGLVGPLARNLCVTADLRLDLGEWQGATDALNEFAILSAMSISASHRAAALATTAKSAALRGDTAAALELVSQTEHSPAARSGSRFLAQAQIVRGIAYVSMGNHVDAYLALARVFESTDPSHHFREQFGAITYLAEAAVRSGRQDHARAVAERMQVIADISGAPLLAMHLSYARAVLAPDDTAEQHFLAGLACDATHAPWPRARLQLAYGRWLRRQQQVTESRAPLQAALEAFQRIGAKRWTEEALDELGASGVHVEERAEGSTPNLLSAQESNIARLVAQGLSNREIAQQLYLSPRTVSSHLYRIFPKLGITTRGQLAALSSNEKDGLARAAVTATVGVGSRGLVKIEDLTDQRP